MRIVDAVITSAVIEEADGDEWFEKMLRNWRRWCWAGGVGPDRLGHCASIEHEYALKRDKEDLDEAEPSPKVEPIDDPVGELFEMACNDLAEAKRNIIRLHYVRWPDVDLRMLFIEDGHDFNSATGDDWRAKRAAIPLAAYLDHLRSGRHQMQRYVHARLMMPKHRARVVA